MSEKTAKTEKTVEDRVAALEGSYSKLNKIIQFLTRQLEKTFGRDFNADGKIGIVLLAFLLTVGVVVAADPVVTWRGDDLATVSVLDDGTLKTVSSTGVTNIYPTNIGVTTATFSPQTNGVLNALTLQTATLTYLSATDVTNTAVVVTNVVRTVIMGVTNATVTLQ
jgi:hypothetical protein